MKGLSPVPERVGSQKAVCLGCQWFSIHYPNPVQDGATTFTYFLNTSDKVEIKIYSVSGFFIKSIKDNSIYQNEYNEIIWDTKDLDSGVYLANLISLSNGKEKDSKIIKVLVINE